MTRYIFGGSPADIVVATNSSATDTVLRFEANATLTAWDAEAGGGQITDLQFTYGGASTSTVTAGPDGRLPRFYGPDGVTQMWIDSGASRRYVVVTTDLGALLDGKLDSDDPILAGVQEALAALSNINRQTGSFLRVVNFSVADNTWPYQADVTATNPSTPILWRGNATIPAQARRGLDYVDQLQAAASTNDPTPTPTPTPDPDPVTGIALSTPTASASGATLSVSGTLTTTAETLIAFAQIAVRGPSGQNADTGFRTNVTVNGDLQLTGTATATESGTWTVWVAYNVTGGSDQASWVDGPTTTIAVTIPTGGDTGGGGGGGGGASGGVPLVGLSGKAWNSGVARWNDSQGHTNSYVANEFAAWRGRPVDGLLGFNGRDSWESMFNIHSDWPSWPGYIVVSIPPQPESQNNSATAAGSNNQRWRDYGSALTAAGLNKSTFIVRLGWECNGYWYAWSWGNEGGSVTPRNTPESFVNAVKNVSTSLKATAPNIKINVCLNRGSKRSGTTWQSVMTPLVATGPSGRYVDIVGLDHYDWYPGQTSSGQFTNAVNQDPGFASIASFCRSQGVQMSVDEWALVNASGGSAGGGGGDNPLYITSMYNQFDAVKDILAYEGYYEDPGAPASLQHRMMLGNYPNAAAAYRSSSRWGS